MEIRKGVVHAQYPVAQGKNLLEQFRGIGVNNFKVFIESSFNIIHGILFIKAWFEQDPQFSLNQLNFIASISYQIKEQVYDSPLNFDGKLKFLITRGVCALLSTTRQKQIRRHNETRER